MKKLLIMAIASLFVIGAVTSAYAVEVTKDLTTTVTANVGSFASFSFGPVNGQTRSQDTLTFKTVDGTSPSGWYYNTLAGLGADGDPNDSKSDIVLKVASNVDFTLKIKKGADQLSGKIGYYVDNAYNWDGTDSVPVGTVYPGSGFGDPTSTWGEVPEAATLIYDSGATGYDDFSMGVSFVLIPGNLPVGTGYLSSITYTMTANM